jgi:hypothetical protein
MPTTEAYSPQTPEIETHPQEAFEAVTQIPQRRLQQKYIYQEHLQQNRR